MIARLVRDLLDDARETRERAATSTHSLDLSARAGADALAAVGNADTLQEAQEIALAGLNEIAGLIRP